MATSNRSEQLEPRGSPVPAGDEVGGVGEPLTTAVRTAADVEAAAQSAGIAHTSSGPVQVLQFSEHLNTDDIKLLELPQPVLSSLQEGDSVFIRGQAQDDAVLCTTSKTYELKLADTSNSILICPTLSYPNDTVLSSSPLITQEVTACLFSVYELRECRPQLGRLKQLLETCPYTNREELEEQQHQQQGDGVETVAMEEGGEEGDRNHARLAAHKYTFSQLLNMVQCSEDELTDGLEQLQACNINGCWRVLDLDYKEQVFQDILTLVDAEGWEWTKIPLADCCVKMAQIAPRFAVEHCLCCYGDRTDFDHEFYKLSEDKVCKFFAELLLRPSGRFNYHEFMESWEQSVPVGMVTKPEQLKGVALTDLSSVPPVIWHYPLSELPQDPAKRFSKLFQVRNKWTYADLEPYISDLETPTQSLNALLLKYTRASTGSQGVKLYNMKTTAL